MTTSLDDLCAVFPGDRSPLVVSDSPRVVAWADRSGLVGQPADEDIPHHPALLLVWVDRASWPEAGRRLRPALEQASVLWVPMAAFADDADDADYCLDRLLASAPARCVEANVAVLDRLASGGHTLRFAGQGSALTCTPGETVELQTVVDAPIALGTTESIGGFFEVAIEPTEQSLLADAGFHVTGEMTADGVVAARSFRAGPEGLARFERALRLQRQVADAGGAQLAIEDGIVTSLVVGGRDRTAELDDLAWPSGRRVLEFGIGTNRSVAPLVDWRVNSQMNEGAGLHLGFGDGERGAHIDFVAPGVDWLDA